MSKRFPYNLWISCGSDAGISFATIGRLAKDSSMMQGILLSLQSLMSTEVDVSDSQFMSGENEYVKFGTYTLPYEENQNVVLQYIVKSDHANEISKHDERLVQNLALSFSRFIVLTPNFYENLEHGRMISHEFVSRAFLNACTIAKQKSTVSEDSDTLLKVVKSMLLDAEKNPKKYQTLVHLENLAEWLSAEEQSWDKGTIIPFKRQLLLQMLAQDILMEIIVNNPFAILEFESPRYVLEEIRVEIEKHLRSKIIEPSEIIYEYIGKKMEKKVNSYLHKLTIDQIHTANSFIAHNMCKEVILNIAKNNPIFGLIDYRGIDLFRTMQTEIGILTEVADQGSIICDSLVEDVIPHVMQSSRLFFKLLITPFTGKNLPSSIWNVLADFTYSIISEDSLQEFSSKKQKISNVPAIKAKQKLLEERLKKMPLIESKWKTQLIERLEESGIGKQLQISNIEESVIFASALEQAIITTMEKMITDQLFSTEIGDVFKYMMLAFKNLAPKVVLGNILTHMMNDLHSNALKTTKNISLGAKDLVGSAIEEGRIKAHVNSIPVQLKRSFFSKSVLRFDGRTVSSTELLQKHGVTLTIDNKIVPLRDIEQDAEFLCMCIADTKILRMSYAKALLRRMTSTYIQLIFTFEGDIIGQIDKLITVFNREITSTLKPAHRIPEVNESFPVFTNIEYIPSRFVDKKYHEKIQTSWNNSAPKIHELMKELLSGFAKLHSNDINYKKKAMKLYDRAIKELKSSRKDLLKQWNKINSSLTDEVEKWSKTVSLDLSSHLEDVNKKIVSWIGDEFKILKLEYNKFTVSANQCSRAISSDVQESLPKDIEKLPKNFMGIALSILLYSRIPDYVIDESYTQMIAKERKIPDVVKNAWMRSKSRREFESNLYLNMRVLGNALIDIINAYARTISSLFIKNDMELANTKEGFYIVIGLLPKELYSTKSEVLTIMQFPGVKVVSSGKKWEIRLFLEPVYRKKMEKYRDSLIVMSDVIRFVAREKFEENTEEVMDGIKSVIVYLIDKGDKNIIDLTETFKEALFKISDYPSIAAKDN